MDADPRTLLRGQIEAIWGDGRVDLVDRLYAADVVDRMPIPGQPSGRAALKDVVRLFRDGLPDLRMKLHGTLAATGEDGARMAVDWWTLTGTHAGPLFGHPATGRPVRFGGIDWVRIEDGVIAELWHVEDLAALEDQVGLPPGPPLPAPLIEHRAEPWAPDVSTLSSSERELLESARAWFASSPFVPENSVLQALLVDGEHAALRWAVARIEAGRPLAWHGMAVLRATAGGVEVVQAVAEEAQRRAQLR